MYRNPATTLKGHNSKRLQLSKASALIGHNLKDLYLTMHYLKSMSITTFRLRQNKYVDIIEIMICTYTGFTGYPIPASATSNPGSEQSIADNSLWSLRGAYFSVIRLKRVHKSQSFRKFLKQSNKSYYYRYF